MNNKSNEKLAELCDYVEYRIKEHGSLNSLETRSHGRVIRTIVSEVQNLDSADTHKPLTINLDEFDNYKIPLNANEVYHISKMLKLFVYECFVERENIRVQEGWDYRAPLKRYKRASMFEDIDMKDYNAYHWANRLVSEQTNINSEDNNEAYKKILHQLVDKGNEACKRNKDAWHVVTIDVSEYEPFEITIKYPSLLKKGVCIKSATKTIKKRNEDNNNKCATANLK
tara:strand:+ start:2339 stop:3019 length:681 start_codon:yes stop_codon:yes gene_type:complete